MIRNLKALGLGLIAVFALSAMAASSASAVDTFTSSVSPVTVSGTSVDRSRFEITTAATVQCHTGEFHGAALQSGSSSVTITAAYKGTVGPPSTDTGHCTSGLGTADIEMDECDYSLSGSTSGSDGGTDATVSILCPTGHEITIHLSEVGVTLDIPAQTPTSGGATYTNVSSTKVKVKVTATGITYTCTPAFICSLGGLPSHGNNADYADEVEISPASGTISVSTS